MQDMNAMQATHFLRLLSRLKPLMAPTLPISTSQQTKFILKSAYASMAYAAGPRRVWSRALVRRIRRNRRRPTMRIINKRRNVVRPRRRPAEGGSEELRKVIPGGDTILNGARLVEETSDYVQFLRTQVIIMKALVSSFSKGQHG